MSIVIPTLNSGRYVGETVKSCLAQTGPSVEVIVVDGGSVDGTLAAVSAVADDRVRVLRQPGNEGRLPGALNAGFAAARGEYLTWISADNYLTGDAIERLTNYLVVHPEVDFVYSDYWLISESGEVLCRAEVGLPEDIRVVNVVQQSFLYRRSVYERVGDHDVSTFPVQDDDYWLRVARVCNMARLGEPLQYYRVHDASLTAQYTGLGLGRLSAALRRKHGYMSWSEYWTEMARLDMASAYESYNRGGRLASVRWLVRSLLRDPSGLRNRGVWSITAQSILGVGLLRRLGWRPSVSE